jgi:Zn-dependent protease
MGTVILPLIMIITGGPVFGWAKPVPFNPYNFKRNVKVRNGAMWVALAGPGSNLGIAFVSSFILVAAQKLLPGFPSVIYFSITQLAQAFIVINLLLASLNLIPIPPLDGSKILMRFLPPACDRYFLMLERYGFLILFILLATGVFSSLVWVPVEFLFRIFLLIPRLLFGVI